MFGGKFQNWLTQLDVKAPAPDRKVIFVRFPGGEVAYRPRRARVATAAESRPMLPRNDVNQIGGVVGMACDAQPGSERHLFHFHRRRFELTENASRLAGVWKQWLRGGRTCRRPSALCSGWRAGLKPGAYGVHGFFRGWENHRTLLLTWTRRAPIGLLRGQHRPAALSQRR